MAQLGVPQRKNGEEESEEEEDKGGGEEEGRQREPAADRQAGPQWPLP